MDVLHHALAALWQVTLAGLLLGAGLPTLFALGLRSLGTAVADDGAPAPPTPAGRAVAALCFGLVAAAALFGIVVIVFGARLFG